MNTQPLPDFSKGQHWHEVSAREMQNLVEAIEQLRNFVFPGGIVRQGAGTFIASAQNDGSGKKPIIVVVTKTGDDAENTPMTVRPLAYTDWPPQVNRVSWAGPDHDAYPEVGASYSDYADIVWTDPNPPTESQQTLKVRSNGGVWIVEKPAKGSSVSTCIILEVQGQSSPWVTVAQLERNDGDVWDGTFRAKIENPITAHLMPGWLGKHVAPFVFAPSNGQFETYATSFVLFEAMGMRIVLPTLKFTAVAAPVAPVRDCRIVA